MHAQSLKASLSISALTAVLALAGCAAGTTSSCACPVEASNSTNWQFQTGTSITGTPQAVFLTGALQQQGTKITGVLSTFAPCQASGTTTVLDYTGTLDTTTNVLSLASSSNNVQAQFTLPSAGFYATPGTPITGTIASTGQICALASSGPGVAMEIPALTGTFSGPLTGPSAATASLSVVQSNNANGTAQFPVTGTLTFTSGSCTASIPLSGSISGAGYTLASTTAASNSATISGLNNAGGSTLPSVTFTFPGGICGMTTAATFTGALSL